VVTAGTQRWVTVSGAVRKPGRYPFEEGLTLGRLVETAGGILRSGGERVVVVRGQGRVEADVGAIRSGDAEDVVLQPGDEVAVRTRRP
jgi:protein involved in polysaccharide export with SLBB domain